MCLELQINLFFSLAVKPNLDKRIWCERDIKSNHNFPDKNVITIKNEKLK